MILTSVEDLNGIDFAKGEGLVPVIAQNVMTGEVRMLGWADRPALERTIAEQRLWFHSRRRAALWRKGETSGHELRVIALHADCDGDAVLALVDPIGPTCHTGTRSCFDAAPLLPALADVIAQRTAAGGDGYTRRLLEDANLRHKKLGEEAVELALACARGDAQSAATEAADLLYHALVACAAAGASVEDVLRVLARRRGLAVAAREDPVHEQ